MSQGTSTFLLRGGLNLVSPAIAIPAGQAIAAVNYEPDVAGYSRVGGYERFDGHPRPSDSDDPTTIAARRAAISSVPGQGPVRGVQVYDGSLYAFRDYTDGTTARMYRATSGGWDEMTFGEVLDFTLGVTEFVEGETVVGGTSAATATIERVVLRTGAWSGTASGYLVLSNVIGTFQSETITSSSGAATIAGDSTAITIPAGGVYDFTTHNFYGAGKRPRLYFTNGQGTAFEWDSESLAPIRTGTAAGILATIDYLLAANGDFILAANGDSIILRADFDRPRYVKHYKNHLFLAYDSGSVINSSIGEPLEYITTTGAGEFSFGKGVTGMLGATAGSLVLFAADRIEYIGGNDSSDFQMLPISDTSGAVAGSIQMLDRPVYLDDAGVRALTSAAAYGDWRMGTLTQLIEPLLKAKRDAGVMVNASTRVKSKDQYRLYFDDGSGITVYVGRKAPEAIPFKLPIEVFCACAGEIDAGLGERLFAGGADGYVYELDRGRSFDGAAIQAYVRLAFNSLGSPTTNKRFNKFTQEVTCEEDITVGIAFDIDYARGLAGSQVNVSVESGSPVISTELYGSVDWTQVVEGLLETHIDGLGRNLAVTLITDAADKLPHTFPSSTINYAQRGLVR